MCACGLHIRKKDGSCRRSRSRPKAHWGYDLDWVRRWVDEGDFSPAGVREKVVVVADGRVIPVMALDLAPHRA